MRQGNDVVISFLVEPGDNIYLKANFRAMATCYETQVLQRDLRCLGNRQTEKQISDESKQVVKHKRNCFLI